MDSTHIGPPLATDDDPCDDWSAAIMIRWTPVIDRRTRHSAGMDEWGWTPVKMPDYPPSRCIPIEPLTGPMKIKGVIIHADGIVTKEQQARRDHMHHVASMYNDACRYCGGIGRHAIGCPNEGFR